MGILRFAAHISTCGWIFEIDGQVLQGSNVLIDDEEHCVITDFGQSEMKNEVFRLSGTMAPRKSNLTLQTRDLY